MSSCPFTNISPGTYCGDCSALAVFEDEYVRCTRRVYVCDVTLEHRYIDIVK